MSKSILQNVLALTFLLAGSEIVAMTSLQQYVKKNFDLKYLLVGIVIYGVIIPYMIVKTLNYDGIGTVNLMWNIITTVAMIIIGYYLFNEKITNLHIISLMLGIASIVLLHMAGDDN
jgi:multidrug transporter EmrE-like cation transporter